MNDSTPDFDSEATRTMSGFLPIVLVAASFALVMLFQISVLLPQRTLLQQALTQNEAAVQQSKQVQDALQRLATDVLTAAADDKDAQAIVSKYGISPGPNGAGKPASSPSK